MPRRRPFLILGPLLLLMPLLGQAVPPVFATPDQADLIRASRSLQDGFEKDAFDKFLRASKLGNKEAQKNVGLMYIKGLGVEKSWPRAHAWLRLAAGHGNAQYRAAQEEIWGALREDEKALAETFYREIKEEYGDAAALKRREYWVRRQRREVTGSRLGTVGAMRIQVTDATGYQWELGGKEFFEVLDTYVEELEPFVGEVEVGELNVLEDDNAN